MTTSPHLRLRDTGRHLYGVIYTAGGDTETLLDVAHGFSPRVECVGAGEVVLDLSGLSRLFGDARALAEEIRRTAAARGLPVRVAIAETQTAARLLVRHRAGLTTIVPGAEAAAVAPLPLEGLGRVVGAAPPGSSDPHALVQIIRRWGLRTLGALAALPVDEVAARLGQAGVRLHRAAQGQDPRPLVPHVPEERFEEACDLEWPIEGLEPLSFVLGRLLDPLAAQLERRDRGAAVLRVRLSLVTRAVHERALQLPMPLREARALRTLILLDLESHPPPAAIDRVAVTVDPTPARVVQGSLLARPLPSPERISTLMARLQALMGETRCGSPAVVDSWEPGAFAMAPFAPSESNDVHPNARDGPRRHRDTEKQNGGTLSSRVATEIGVSLPVQPQSISGRVLSIDEGGRDDLADPLRQSTQSRGEVLRGSVTPWFVGGIDSANGALALRRFRTPVVARVRVEQGRPVSVSTPVAGLTGGRVEMAAGPWRTSGAWWLVPDAAPAAPEPGEAGTGPRRTRRPWDRDEWDVTLSNGTTCRIFRARDTGAWFLEAIVD